MAELAVNKERAEGKQIDIDEENLISEKTSQDRPKSLKYKVLTASEAEKLIEENKQKPMDKNKPSIFERFKEAIFTKVFRAKAEQYRKLEERLKEQEKIIAENNKKFEEEKEELRKVIEAQEDDLKLFKKDFSISKTKEEFKDNEIGNTNDKENSSLYNSVKEEEDNITVPLNQNDVSNTRFKEEELNKTIDYQPPIKESEIQKTNVKEVVSNLEGKKENLQDQEEVINFFNSKNTPVDVHEQNIGLVERLKESIFAKFFKEKADEFAKLQEKVAMQEKMITENNIRFEKEKIELKKIIDMQREELKELRKELRSKDNSQKNIKEKGTLKKDDSKDLIKKSAKEIKNMVLEHKEWIESKGKKGKKLNLENVDLQGKKLLNVDLREANFKNANLNNCTIYGDLRGADLTGIKLNDKTSFVGSNLKGITIENKEKDIIKDKLNKNIDKHKAALKELKTNKKEQDYQK